MISVFAGIAIGPWTLYKITILLRPFAAGALQQGVVASEDTFALKVVSPSETCGCVSAFVATVEPSLGLPPAYRAVGHKGKLILFIMTH